MNREENPEWHDWVCDQCGLSACLLHDPPKCPQCEGEDPDQYGEDDW